MFSISVLVACSAFKRSDSHCSTLNARLRVFVCVFVVPEHVSFVCYEEILLSWIILSCMMYTIMTDLRQCFPENISSGISKPWPQEGQHISNCHPYTFSKEGPGLRYRGAGHHPQMT